MREPVRHDEGMLAQGEKLNRFRGKDAHSDLARQLLGITPVWEECAARFRARRDLHSSLAPLCGRFFTMSPLSEMHPVLLSLVSTRCRASLNRFMGQVPCRIRSLLRADVSHLSSGLEAVGAVFPRRGRVKSAPECVEQGALL